MNYSRLNLTPVLQKCGLPVLIAVRAVNQNQQKVTLMLNTNEKIIKHKVGLLNLAEELGNVSKACKIMGLSRDTFYRYKSAVDEGGVEALFEQGRSKPNPKNRVDEKIEAAVTQYAIDFPVHGQQHTSNELHKQGVFVSGSGMRSIWLRYQLANFRDWLEVIRRVIEKRLTQHQAAE